jgi:hypothetical protein
MNGRALKIFRDNEGKGSGYKIIIDKSNGDIFLRTWNNG